MGVSVSDGRARRSACGALPESLLTAVWLSRVGDPVSTLLAPDVVVVVAVFSLELEDESLLYAVCSAGRATGVAGPTDTGAEVAALACPCSTLRVSGAAPLVAVLATAVVAAAGEARCCSLWSVDFSGVGAVMVMSGQEADGGTLLLSSAGSRSTPSAGMPASSSAAQGNQSTATVTLTAPHAQSISTATFTAPDTQSISTATLTAPDTQSISTDTLTAPHTQSVSTATLTAQNNQSTTTATLTAQVRSP